jgi:hypothetical protein
VNWKSINALDPLILTLRIHLLHYFSKQLIFIDFVVFDNHAHCDLLFATGYISELVVLVPDKAIFFNFTNDILK